MQYDMAVAIRSCPPGSGRAKKGDQRGFHRCGQMHGPCIGRDHEVALGEERGEFGQSCLPGEVQNAPGVFHPRKDLAYAFSSSALPEKTICAPDLARSSASCEKFLLGHCLLGHLAIG